MISIKIRARDLISQTVTRIKKTNKTKYRTLYNILVSIKDELQEKAKISRIIREETRHNAMMQQWLPIELCKYFKMRGGFGLIV